MNFATLVRLLACALVVCLSPIRLPAQMPPKSRKAAAPPACDQVRALALVEQQATDAKSFDEDPAGQIAILLRAADLLWPYKQEAAHNVFNDAYTLAVEYFKRRGDETRREGNALGHGVLIQLPDQRFKVLTAIARRDPVWARRLAGEVADDSVKAANESGAQGQNAFTQTGDKLLSVADSMLAVNRELAINFAHMSLQQPASFYLPRFLYRLAEIDRGAADQLYRDALRAYAGATMQDLFYLSAYPFALRNVIGPTRVSMPYVPPDGYAGNGELQRLYLETLLRLAEAKLNAQAQPVEPNVRRSDPELILTALTVLDPLIAGQQPAFAERATVLKATANALLSQAAQRSAAGFAESLAGAPAAPDEDSFTRAVEQAERQTDPDRRDQMLTMAVTGASPKVELARLENAAQKIGDQDTRRQLLNALYYARAEKAIKDSLFDDAARLLAKVDALGERALLALALADASIKQLKDNGRAREALESAYKIAQSAPPSEERARALVGIATLYAKFDSQRAFEVLGDAVKAMNQAPGLSLDAPPPVRRIEGKTFGTYMDAAAPAVSLDSPFRELGPHDFEGTLGHARNLDKPVLRAAAILALAARCLEPPPASKPTKQPAAHP
jgi:hypothetical protein